MRIGRFVYRGGMMAMVLWMVVGWSPLLGAESALFNGRGVIYGGVGAGYHFNRLDGEDTHSRRFVFMSSYGLARWMEVSVQMGVADLEIEGRSGRTDFRGEYKVAVGAGARVRLLDLFGSSVLIYGEGSGCLFPSTGKVSQRTDTGTIQSTVEYDWLEGEAALGAEFPSIGWYMGAWVEGVETQADGRSYLIEEAHRTDLPGWHKTYRSGARWGGFAGKMFPLRRNFRLKVSVHIGDVQATGPKMASIRIDLTQLYRPEKEPF